MLHSCQRIDVFYGRYSLSCSQGTPNSFPNCSIIAAVPVVAALFSRQRGRIKISVFGLDWMVVWGSLIVKFGHLFSVKSCIANQSPKSYSSISCNFLAWIRNTVKCSIRDWKWKVVLHFRPDSKVFQMAFWKQNKDKIYSLTYKLLDSRYVYYFMKHRQEAILYLWKSCLQKK